MSAEFWGGGSLEERVERLERRMQAVARATAGHDGLLSTDDYALLHQFTTATGWTALAYAANWSWYGASEGFGQYRIGPDRRVYVMGAVKKSAALVAGDVIATLPSFARPVYNKRFACVSNLGYTEIAINNAGNIIVVAGGSAALISLDGIAFDPLY